MNQATFYHASKGNTGLSNGAETLAKPQLEFLKLKLYIVFSYGWHLSAF